MSGVQENISGLLKSGQEHLRKELFTSAGLNEALLKYLGAGYVGNPFPPVDQKG